MEQQNFLEQVPHLHIRGTHYNVGLSIGQTYSGLIKNYLETLSYFNDVLLVVYSTEKGKSMYDTCLECCTNKFPQYVRELEGIATGAGIPFYHLFLLHLETLIAPENNEGQAYHNLDVNNDNDETPTRTRPGTSLLGCTSILSNHQDMILGHTEDTPPEMVNHFFIVSAHIIDEKGVTLEKFYTLTYPGYLPGYTMGFNHHGIVYSVNTIYPSRTFHDRTPVNFLTRALLAAKNETEVMKTLRDAGTGISDGFSLNLVFVKESESSDATNVTACNIEIGPNPSEVKESLINVQWVPTGSSYVHCNRYLRLDIPEQQGPSFRSSCRRHAAIENFIFPPNSMENVKEILSDRSDDDFPVFRSGLPALPMQASSDDKDDSATIAIGLFSIKKRTWSLYIRPPNASEPVVEIPIKFVFDS